MKSAKISVVKQSESKGSKTSMTTNVAIVTNFRTASTTFTLEKSEEYNLPYKGELFSHERPFAIGKVPSQADLMRKDIVDQEVTHLCCSHWNIYEQLRNKVRACYKIMPFHFRFDKDFVTLEHVLKEADKVYYLYRKDFRAQILSWIAVRITGTFEHTGFDTNIGMTPTNVEEAYVGRMHQLHRGTFQTAETYQVNIGPAEEAWFNTKTDLNLERLIGQLEYNYKSMAEMYKRVPGELVCYEDYFSGSKYKPYNRQINWTSEPQIDSYVNNWDIEGLFK